MEFAHTSDTSAALRLGVPPQIHADDFLYQFLCSHPHLKSTATQHYFESARESANRIKELIAANLKPTGIASFSIDDFSLLDFASGFGMVGRHLPVVLPGARIEACDIHPKAVEFNQDILNIRAHLSAASPAELNLTGNYNVVVALSFFSHLPSRTWKQWFARLTALVSEDGLFIFTTHGLPSGVSKSLDLIKTGAEFHFTASSEQGDLPSEEYGTSYSHPRYVMNVLKDFPGLHLSEFKMGAWWGGNQDAYVIAKASPSASSQKTDWWQRLASRISRRLR